LRVKVFLEDGPHAERAAEIEIARDGETIYVSDGDRVAHDVIPLINGEWNPTYLAGWQYKFHEYLKTGRTKQINGSNHQIYMFGKTIEKFDAAIR
jgi:hypothetical protein